MSEVPLLPGSPQWNTLPNRQLMGKRFTVVKILGHGSFGEVVLVKDKQANGSLAVVKRFCKLKEKDARQSKAEKQQLQATIEEARIMSSFNDDGIVRFIDLWYEEEEGFICFLMEYCSGGDLEDYLHQNYPLSEVRLLQLFLQCLLALAHIHTKEVVHRDLKLSNILVASKGGKVPTVKVADFGLSTFYRDIVVDDPVCFGTPLYMSPETITRGLCNYGSDVWSLGVAFYHMMSKCHPFSGTDIPTLQKSIAATEPPHLITQLKRPYSRELGNLVMSMLEKHAAVRPNVRQLIDSPLFTQILLQSPWRSRPLRGTLCLFVCHTNYVIHIFAKPRLGAKVVGKLYFGAHVFVSKEINIPVSSVYYGSSVKSLSTTTSITTEPSQDVIVWYYIVGPCKGYCVKYERGCNLLRHVGDCTPCGPILITRKEENTRHSLPETTHPNAVPLPITSCSPSRKKLYNGLRENVMSFLFKECG